MKARQPSSVYSPFSLRLKAPAPVAAQVSIMLICTRSNFCSVLANQLRASSTYSLGSARP